MLGCGGGKGRCREGEGDVGKCGRQCKVREMGGSWGPIP